jgi:hypothetical protein
VSAAAVLVAGCFQAAAALSNKGWTTHAGESFCCSGRRGITNAALVHGARMQHSGRRGFSAKSTCGSPIARQRHGTLSKTHKPALCLRCRAAGIVMVA